MLKRFRFGGQDSITNPNPNIIRPAKITNPNLNIRDQEEKIRIRIRIFVTTLNYNRTFSLPYFLKTFKESQSFHEFRHFKSEQDALVGSRDVVCKRKQFHGCLRLTSLSSCYNFDVEKDQCAVGMCSSLPVRSRTGLVSS